MNYKLLKALSDARDNIDTVKGLEPISDILTGYISNIMYGEYIVNGIGILH